MITAAQQAAQQNRDTIFVENGQVIAVDEFAGEQFIMRIRAPKCAAKAEPGTFVHISCDQAIPMRRPLSIMRVEDDCIDVLYKIVGSGLRWLAAKRPGDVVSVLGPIGQPFRPTVDRPNVLMIGGGVGIPPMVFLADSLRQDNRFRPLAILGSELPFPFAEQSSSLATEWTDDAVTATMPLMEQWGIPCRLATMSGFAGCYNGYVTGLAEQWLASLSQEALQKTEVFTCGPTPMLKAVADLAARFDLPCQVSLEEFMACAVGGCAGCAVRIRTPDGDAMKRVCVDGPVFEASTVIW